MRYFQSAIVALSLACVAVIPAAAQDLNAYRAGYFAEAYPPRIAARIQAFNKTFESVGLGEDRQSKGLVNAALLWPPQMDTITICYMNGSQPLRQFVTSIALEWTRLGAHIPLDFGDTQDPRKCEKDGFAHIRVLLNDRGVNYSAIGVVSFKVLSQDEPSMQIGVINPESKQFVNPMELRRLILHEFGHAVGLSHEHQSPIGKCRDEYDWDVIYKKLAQPPHGWPKEQVDRNMNELNQPGVFASAFDNKSVMIYSFPREFYKQGEKSRCYAETNFSISAIDATIVRELYPPDETKRVAKYDTLRKSLRQRIEASGSPESSKSAVFQVLDDLLPASR